MMAPATVKVFTKHNNKLFWAFLFAWLVAFPVATYWTPTSRNITAETVAEPFIGSDTLVYRWSGEVRRSCNTSIRREIIDKDGIVTQFLPIELPPIPLNRMGYQTYEISVKVPRKIPEGPAIYQATETPKCTWLQRVLPKGFKYPAVEFTITRE